MKSASSNSVGVGTVCIGRPVGLLVEAHPEARFAFIRAR